jgi:DNA mismatch endonuclease, patch repair protein
MPDVFTKEKRSQVMSRIRGRANKETELVLVTLFRQHKITGWRRQGAILVRSSRREEAHFETLRSPGRRSSVRASSPRLLRVSVDFVFRKERVIVFVDGCFWHGCPKHSNMPVNNRAFWEKKLTANKVRDRLVTRTLRQGGWRVIRIWEHDLSRRPVHCIKRIQRGLLSGTGDRR